MAHRFSVCTTGIFSRMNGKGYETYFQKEIQFSDNCRYTVVKMVVLYLFLLFNKKRKFTLNIILLTFAAMRVHAYFIW